MRHNALRPWSGPVTTTFERGPRDVDTGAGKSLEGEPHTPVEADVDRWVEGHTEYRRSLNPVLPKPSDDLVRRAGIEQDGLVPASDVPTPVRAQDVGPSFAARLDFRAHLRLGQADHLAHPSSMHLVPGHVSDPSPPADRRRDRLRLASRS